MPSRMRNLVEFTKPNGINALGGENQLFEKRSKNFGKLANAPVEP
jgi:hypothetical protein